jgi:GT2 family glycosyltransferase
LQSADFAGGRVDVMVEDPRRMIAAEAFESVFAFQNERYVNDLNFTVTASMFVWRSAFEAVGDFDNGVPEDLDWCRRARVKGYRIGFASRSIVQHPARRTIPELKRKSRRLTLEWCEAARRDGKRPTFMLARHWAMVLSIPVHSYVALASKRLSGIRNRMLAVGASAQIRAYRLAIAHRAVLGSIGE